MGSFSHGRGLDRGSDRPRSRLRRYLAARCATPKQLAREIQCSAKTAENILAEHWPSDLVLANIIRRFGRDVWEVVFLPDLDPVEAQVLAEIQVLERKLAEQKAHLRAVAGAATAEAIGASRERRSPAGPSQSPRLAAIADSRG